MTTQPDEPLRVIPIAFRSNKSVIALASELLSWGPTEAVQQFLTMFTSTKNMIVRTIRLQMVFLLAFVAVLFVFGSQGVKAEVRSADIEAIFGLAVEVRPPSAIVIASNSGLVTLTFDSESELRIGSNRALVEEIAEGDRVISTATRNADNDLVALRTLVRVANTQPTTKHVVGVVSSASDDQLSIQTRNSGVVNVLIPAGIDAPSVGDGITMVARLDRSSGILSAIGFELTSTTVERIQKAQDKASDNAESARLAQIAIDARTQHLSALDDAARALKRVLDSDLEDQDVLDKTAAQYQEIQRRFEELQRIYKTSAQTRGEVQPLLKISGGLVDDIGFASFTIVPTGVQDANPFSVKFSYDREKTTVDLPKDLLDKISGTASNPQLLSDVRRFIDPASELEVKYSIEGEVRTAVSINVREPRLVSELEAVLEHESRRAFTGVITLVEIDVSLEDALGIVIATNEKLGVKVAAKVTGETEITLDGHSSGISGLGAGQYVDIQFESSSDDSISDITGSDVTLRALAIRARSSAPSGEDHISGIVESLDLDAAVITIRPTDGALVRLTVGDDAQIVRNGSAAVIADVKIGDLVIDATRLDTESSDLTRLVVVSRKNVKFSGTVTGIGREPDRLQVTGVNGQSLNVLITDETWVIVDERRVKFSSVVAGMNIVRGVYSVTGRGGTFYNVGTIVSIESPKVGKASGIITSVNFNEGKLTVLSGKSTETKLIELQMPETPLGENLIKDGVPIRSLLTIERGDRVDIVFYVLDSGIVQKLSVVSDNFIQSRGTLVSIPDSARYVVVKLVDGREFDLWIGRETSIQLNGHQIQSLRPVTELIADARERGTEISTLVSEVLFIRDSVDSNLGVIISIKFQVKFEGESSGTNSEQQGTVELSVSGVIEAIDGDSWVINGRVFTVNRATQYRGHSAGVGEVVVAVLISRSDGSFVARLISKSGR
jgi:hypothetical protein